jgi:hypothetical protein
MICHSGNGILSGRNPKRAGAIDHTDIVDVNQLSATIARDCPELRDGAGSDAVRAGAELLKARCS